MEGWIYDHTGNCVFFTDDGSGVRLNRPEVLDWHKEREEQGQQEVQERPDLLNLLDQHLGLH